MRSGASARIRSTNTSQLSRKYARLPETCVSDTCTILIGSLGIVGHSPPDLRLAAQWPRASASDQLARENAAFRAFDGAASLMKVNRPCSFISRPALRNADMA